jgi:hypothetical protein
MNLKELWESVQQAAKSKRRGELIELLTLLSSEDETVLPVEGVNLGELLQLRGLAKVLCDRLTSLGDNPSKADVRKQCKVIEVVAGGALHLISTG